MTAAKWAATFIEKVWRWKNESGGMIFNQLKRLGASCDWSRERFTMDDGLSEAVLKVFVRLYKEGLIYRGKRLVNWDPKFETAISDLEVENKEVDGHMWHFKYPLAGGETYEYVEKGRRRERDPARDARLHLHRDDAARKRCSATARSPFTRPTSATSADCRQAVRNPGRAEGTPPQDPDHHR
jgi:hypothetical protein